MGEGIVVGRTVEDLGVVVDVAEGRTAAVCVNDDGDSRLVVAARGWALVVDPLTGDCDQLTFEEYEYPYASMATRDGHFWTGAGQQLIEIDPFALTLTTHRPCPDEEIVGFGLAEGPDGRVWLTTHPHCRLFAFDPQTRTFSEGPRLSETESYVSHLALDTNGWLYAGIGTAHKDLVAISPDGELRSLLSPERRTKGTGWVHRDATGQVWAHADADELHPPLADPEAPRVAGEHWMRCEGFDLHPVAVDAVRPSQTWGRGFERIHQPRPTSWRVCELALADRRLVVERADGSEHVMELTYRSSGANLSPMVATGGGLLVGTSNHPLRLHQSDLATGGRIVHARGPMVEAGGNVAAWAEQDGVLIGAAYLGGHVYRFDPGAPVAAGTNPVRLGQVPQASRPRCAVAHPDGEHVIWGGYGAYGDTAGALVVQRLGDPEDAWDVIGTDRLGAGHSPISVAVDRAGDLLVGTCVETPGGATPIAETAALVRISWPELDVLGRWEPYEGVRSWAGVVPAADGTVHLISRDGWHLWVDPVAEDILGLDDLRSHGPVALGGIVRSPGAVEVLQAEAITRIDLADHSLGRPITGIEPISVGGARIGSELYVGSGSRLLRISDVVVPAHPTPRSTR